MTFSFKRHKCVVVMPSFVLPLSINSSRASYTLRYKIGSGSTSEVFATDCGHAVKLVEFTATSAEEYHILTNFNHPNLIHAFDHGITKIFCFQDDKQQQVAPVFYFYFVMRCSTTSMLSFSVRQSPFFLRIKYIKDIYRGLRFLINNHHIHGDIHPKNILMMQNGDCMLCDFNLSYSPLDVSVKFCETSTVPFCSPLSLINNGYLLTDECKQQFDQCTTDQKKQMVYQYKPGKTMMDIALNEKIDVRDQQKCDVFAFGQLMTYILFNEKSFCMGSDMSDAAGYISNLIEFCKQGEQMLYTYLNNCLHVYQISESIQVYSSTTSTSLNVSTLFNVLVGCLRLKQADRFFLHQLDCILSW